MQVGFLTYDLQEFTADCLSRVSKAIPFALKAYPVFERVADASIDFNYRPSTLTGRFFAVRRKNCTPEGLTSSLNWGAAWDCVRENQVVVLFGIQGATALLATFLAILMRRQLISVNQTMPPEWERKRVWYVRWLKSCILRRCHIHVYQTPITLSTLTGVYGLQESTCIEAPFEAGAHAFQELLARITTPRQELRGELGWSSEECIFLFIGTLLEFKGVQTILSAAASLLKQHVNFRVIFYGPPASQPGDRSIAEYRSLAESLKVHDIVEFKGQCDPIDIAKACRAGDALLLPTQRDMWPKVLVEAAVAALPLVTTTACGAAHSLVSDNETGFIIPPNDPAALANAMHKLLTPETRARLGSAARTWCLRFSDADKETDGFARAIGMVTQ